MRWCPLLFVLGMLFAANTGCIAGGFGVTAGPAVDTRANVGMLVKGRLAWGIALSKRKAVRQVMEAGGGAEFVNPRGWVVVGAGFDFVRQSDKRRGRGWRVGLHARYLGTASDASFDGRGWAGAPAALLFQVDKDCEAGHEKGLTPDSCKYSNFGIEFEPGVVFNSKFPRDKETYGVFFLGAVYERNFFSRFNW